VRHVEYRHGGSRWRYHLPCVFAALTVAARWDAEARARLVAASLPGTVLAPS
jgi:hypothetical protein